MGAYDSFVATAKRMINEKGQTVEWKSITNNDPATPGVEWEEVPVISVSYYPKVVFLPNERYGREFFRYFKGTDVPVGNLLGYMAKQNFIPSLKDVVIRDGVELPILSFYPYNPNGEGDILYAIEFDGIKSV